MALYFGIGLIDSKLDFGMIAYYGTLQASYLNQLQWIIVTRLTIIVLVIASLFLCLCFFYKIWASICFHFQISIEWQVASTTSQKWRRKAQCPHTLVDNNNNPIYGFFFFFFFEIKNFAKISKKLAKLFGFTLRKNPKNSQLFVQKMTNLIEKNPLRFMSLPPPTPFSPL